jgi:sugar/nucleoside kinase (ribokinase family)
MPWIERRLSDFGVSSKGLHRSRGRTGTTVSVSSKVDRSFFTFVGDNSKLGEYLAGETILDHLMQARHVHFAMPLTSGLAARLLGKLTAAGRTTSLDVGHQATWLRDSANLRTCSMVRYLLPNEREARILCSGDALAYLDFTRQRRWPSGVVKLGPAGAMMRTDNGPLVTRSPEVEVVDTTGAGDAFDAGFIDGLLDNEGGEECMRRGCVCGGLSTRVAGALRGLPTRDELNRCYEESYG